MTADIWDDIQDHAESPYHYGKVQCPTHCGKAEHLSCGDSVSIELRVENGIIIEAWFQGDGCVVSQASASMLMQAIQCKPLSFLGEMTATTWLAKFKGIVTPRKRQCVLLAIEALATIKTT